MGVLSGRSDTDNRLQNRFWIPEFFSTKINRVISRIHSIKYDWVDEKRVYQKNAWKTNRENYFRQIWFFEFRRDSKIGKIDQKQSQLLKTKRSNRSLEILYWFLEILITM